MSTDDDELKSQRAVTAARLKAERRATAEQLAADVREWRGDMSLAKAAPYLGMSRRTLEGIEQGRGFPQPELIRIAMRAAKLPKKVAAK